MSMCKTCYFGIHISQNVTDHLTIPATKDSSDEEGYVDSSEANQIDLTQPMRVEEVVYKVNCGRCFWMPADKNGEKQLADIPMEVNDVKSCSRYEPK